MDRANDIRRFSDIVGEASLRDIASKAGDAIAAFSGDETAIGRKESKKVSKVMRNKFRRWLGRSDQEATEASLMNFLVGQLGFTADNARKLLNKANVQDPTKAESINETLLLELSNSEIDKVFDAAAQFALQHNLIDIDDDDDGKTKSRRHARDRYDRRYGRERNHRRDNVDDPLRDLKKYASKSEKEAEPAAEVKPSKDHLQVNKAELVAALNANGLNKTYLNDLTDIIEREKSFKDLKSRPDSKEILDQLAKVGYSFIKANQ